jgi:type VI secretion system secreted protein VgrG
MPIKPCSGTLTDPVEKFAKPLLHLDTPASAVWVTPASISLFSGQNTSMSTQGDTHITSAYTVSSVSGQTTSLYTHSGGIKAITANASLSLQAHTDALQIWADKDITVHSTTDEIRIYAKDSITLNAGQSQILLKGADITMTCPGKFTAKGAVHAWEGPGQGTLVPLSLPVDLVNVPKQTVQLRYGYHDGEAVAGAHYSARMGDGSVRKGQLNAAGLVELEDAPPGPVTFTVSSDPRSFQKFKLPGAADDAASQWLKD